MPSPSEHYEQSAINRSFTTQADPQLYVDWVITTRYYEAVHLIRAWLATRGETAVEDHAHARRLLREKRFPPHLKLAYQQLEDLSRDSRYQCEPFDVLQAALANSQSYLHTLRAGIPLPKPRPRAP